jgi:hypothetical protein
MWMNVGQQTKTVYGENNDRNVMGQKTGIDIRNGSTVAWKL